MNRDPMQAYLDKAEKFETEKPTIKEAVQMLKHIVNDTPLEEYPQNYEMYPKLMLLADVLGMNRKVIVDKLLEGYKSMACAEAAIKTAIFNSRFAANTITNHTLNNPTLYPLCDDEMTPF